MDAVRRPGPGEKDSSGEDRRQTLGLSSSQAEDDIDVGVDKLCAQISNALSSVAGPRGTTIDLSRELVRMRRKAFAEGMATSTEVVDAEVMLSKVRIAVLLAYYEYDVALANLLSLCGAPSASSVTASADGPSRIFSVLTACTARTKTD